MSQPYQMPQTIYGSSPPTAMYNPLSTQYPQYNSGMAVNSALGNPAAYNSIIPMMNGGMNTMNQPQGMPMGYQSQQPMQNQFQSNQQMPMPQNQQFPSQPQPQHQLPVPQQVIGPSHITAGAQSAIPSTLQISEIRIESLLAASKAPKGTFYDIYAEFLIAPLQETGAINPLDHRRGSTCTVSPTEIMTSNQALGSNPDPKKAAAAAAGIPVICNVVWYNQDIILQNCRPDWSRLKFAICKFPKPNAGNVEVNQWAERNPLKRKPLCFGELSVPWDRLPAYANCSEEIHYLDSKGTKTYGGRIQFKVTKTAEFGGSVAGGPGGGSYLSPGGQLFGSSPTAPGLVPTMTYSTAGGMTSIAPGRNMANGVYGDGLMMGSHMGGPLGTSLPASLVTGSQAPQLPYDPTQVFTGGMIRPVTFAQSDFLPEHRKFLTKAAPPPPVRAHPLHQLATPPAAGQDQSAAAGADQSQQQQPQFGGMSQGNQFGLPPNPAAAAAAYGQVKPA